MHGGARHVRDLALVLVAVVVRDQRLVVLVVHDVPPVDKRVRLKVEERKRTDTKERRGNRDERKGGRSNKVRQAT